jgi:Protein of unknown function (DUF1194)
MRHLFASLLSFLLFTLPVRAEMPVDVELVLAVDTSRSMDFEELEIQREGYASALEHPAVTSVFGMGRHGKVALTYFEWGGLGQVNILIDWTVLSTPEDAAKLAEVLRSKPVYGQRGTSISGAIEWGVNMIEANGFEGDRKVIDVSGDGPNNSGRNITFARDLAARKGVTVNGLPFMIKRPDGPFSIPDLDIYYEDCVITGDEAFVIPVYEMERLVTSIRQKLVLEISGLQPPEDERVYKAGRTDCMIGEKLRRSWEGNFYEP